MQLVKEISVIELASGLRTSAPYAYNRLYNPRRLNVPIKPRMQFLKLSFLFALVCTTLFVIGQDESRETVEDRLQPFGNLCMQGEDCGTVAPVTVSVSRSGIEVYNAHCFACHATGVSEAPLVGAEEWQVRLNEKGAETLLANTRAGFNVVMPAMGTCMNCTDAELQAAIDYLVNGE